VFQGRVSDRTDQYALAVSYCLLRGGRLPFPDTPRDFAPGYVRPAPDLTMLTPAERPALARALSPVPQDRWPSCSGLLAELGRMTAPAPHVPAAATERRQGQRYRADSAVGCAVLATLGNEAWEATVQNLSAGGARLRVVGPGCPLRPGRMLELSLSSAVRGLRVEVRLRLTHGAECAGGDYEVGGSFETPLRPEELAALVEGGNL
jgi:hypothetical protein